MDGMTSWKNKEKKNQNTLTFKPYLSLWSDCRLDSDAVSGMFESEARF